MVTPDQLSRRRWYFINHLSKEEKKMFAALAKMYEVGAKMKCQEIIGPYIVDFTLPPKMLALEIDGPSHRYRCGQDYRKNWYLANLGFTVLRVKNRDIRKHVSSVKSLVQKYRVVCNWKERYWYALKKAREEIEHPGQLSLL